MRRLVLALAAAAVSSLVPAARAAQPPSAISVTSFALFPYLRADCSQNTARQTWFANTVIAIYWAATFSDWDGQHSFRVDWVRPNGQLYDIEGKAATGAGSLTWCNREFIAGYPAARHRGVWGVRLYLDGQLNQVLHFHLYGPDPRKTYIVRLRSLRL